jgi:hypothetical protein
MVVSGVATRRRAVPPLVVTITRSGVLSGDGGVAGFVRWLSAVTSTSTSPVQAVLSE